MDRINYAIGDFRCVELCFTNSLANGGSVRNQSHWWAQRDSNPRPTRCKLAALTN